VVVWFVFLWFLFLLCFVFLCLFFFVVFCFFCVCFLVLCGVVFVLCWFFFFFGVFFVVFFVFVCSIFVFWYVCVFFVGFFFFCFVFWSLPSPNPRAMVRRPRVVRPHPAIRHESPEVEVREIVGRGISSGPPRGPGVFDVFDRSERSVKRCFWGGPKRLQ